MGEGGAAGSIMVTMMSRGKVLVVDDDPALFEFIRATLERQGYGVVTAVDGDALLLARHMCPDVILLDIMMPGMSGVGVSGRLRADPATAPIPLIAMAVQPRLASTAPLMDVDDWLVKPIDQDELCAMVARWVRTS